MEAVAALTCLVAALALRPWRLLAGGALLTPLLAHLVLLPWLWALPALHRMPLQLPWSGACLAVLMLGWPLAVPTLALAAGAAALLAGGGLDTAATQLVWQGLLPGTLALLLGAALRRWAPRHLFVYLLGRAFLGTAVCLFVTSLLAQGAGHLLPGVDAGSSAISRWLMAWGEAVVTGMLATIFVVYRPRWLATWSDPLYLPRP